MRNEAKMASGIFIGFTEQVEIYNHTHARRHARTSCCHMQKLL